jgi:peptide/nickel transport system ATP-binding protein
MERSEPAPVVVGARPLLTVENLEKQFNASSRRVGRRSKSGSTATWALKGVSLELRDGVNVGVIGESGSGKTTLARCLLGLEQPTSGLMEVDGHRYESLPDLSHRDQAAVRATMQCVFQDPYSSLNPSHSIGYILGEAIKLRADGDIVPKDVALETEALLAEVDLPADFVKRRPVTLSGGQRQRVAIARALAMRPKILVCDEPVAALDASVQAQVLEVLRKIQAKGINLLFITHDLPVVRQMTDELVVLFRGEVAERGLTADVIDHPQHAYTKKLLAAVPTGTSDWLGRKTEVYGGMS